MDVKVNKARREKVPGEVDYVLVTALNLGSDLRNLSIA
jgi:hypothetical protein